VNNDVAVRFGQNLRHCRQRAGLSQERFADLSGIHRTMVSKFERGENQPMLETLVKIACALDVPVDELLTGISWRAPERDFGSLQVSGPVGDRLDRDGAADSSRRRMSPIIKYVPEINREASNLLTDACAPL
jgi:transcriptional regulator with XRE-family HTH domain